MSRFGTRGREIRARLQCLTLLAHDLRSPITAMRLRMEEARLHPGETDWAETLTALQASLDRLEATVTDHLTLVRLESDAEIVKECVNFSDLIASELRRRTFRIRVSCDVQPGIVTTGDGPLLTRLLTSLVHNAEDRTASAVTIALRRAGDEAVLQVTDDGAGIPADRWETAFDSLVQPDTAGTSDTAVAGLGLPIAREIAEQHGGTLTIEESAQGVRFVLRVPDSDPA
ncbi:HAMP domain-containing sensor histidine kinase [Nonomuraea sp. NPDC050643]|uniref:sensor histidine kinase n=1 Tax=Nonomuraea sp. NPDC050643 TaxID=3155660 RepID=UPI00341036BD